MKILFLFFFFYSKFFWLHFTEIVLNNYEAENIIFLRKQSWKYNGALVYFSFKWFQKYNLYNL